MGHKTFLIEKLAETYRSTEPFQKAHWRANWTENQTVPNNSIFRLLWCIFFDRSFWKLVAVLNSGYETKIWRCMVTNLLGDGLDFHCGVGRFGYTTGPRRKFELSSRSSLVPSDGIDCNASFAIATYSLLKVGHFGHFVGSRKTEQVCYRARENLSFAIERKEGDLGGWTADKCGSWLSGKQTSNRDPLVVWDETRGSEGFLR